MKAGELCAEVEQVELDGDIFVEYQTLYTHAQAISPIWGHRVASILHRLQLNALRCR